MIADFLLNIIGNITTIIEKYNYMVIFFFMTIESSFVPFPSEIVMIPAGYLASQGKVSFTLSLLAGILGSIAGALINYQIAKTIGLKTLKKYGQFFLIPPKKLEKILLFFKKHGSISTFTGRLIPGIRQYISFPAGLANMSLKKFIFFTSLGSGLWTLTLIIIGFMFEQNEALIKNHLKIVTISSIIISLLLIIIYITLHKAINNK